MKRYIRITLILVMLVTLCLMVVSCSKKQNSQNNERVLKGNIKIVTDVEHGPQFEFAAEAFEKLHKKVNINVSTVKDTDNNVEAIFNGPQYEADITTINDSSIRHIITKNSEKFLEMTGSVKEYKDKLLTNKIYNDTIKGKIYALPWDTYPKALLYRKDIFDKEGIDVNTIKSWSDYIEVGRKISKDTGKIFIANSSEDNNDIYLLLSNQLGTSYFNQSGKSDFKSQKWARVIEISKILYGEGLIQELSSKDEIINKAQLNKIVSFIADPTYAVTLMNKFPQSKGKWGVMKLPAFEDGGNRDVSLGGTNLVINENTSESNLSEEFVKFALTDGKLQMDLLNKYGRFPVSTDAYNFVDLNKNITYFDSTIWNLFGSVEQGSFNINYTKNFPDIREKIKGVLNQTNIKSENYKSIIEGVETILK
ncbi:ABC transporter substrate-binding protein [Clostridium ljungdahlii]|uniref:Putative arabinose-binding protein n=1 Tax=Clostridium ljungdahlii TaxID=1538 RepID=A0A168NN06_9CLOT|nr:ABC transporter substrate-binding protein [Clostridium ljungdahlii]OAA86669.1 putative arabinose-binding protein precursor [Clostridium ljungdahlii]